MALTALVGFDRFVVIYNQKFPTNKDSYINDTLLYFYNIKPPHFKTFGRKRKRKKLNKQKIFFFR